MIAEVIINSNVKNLNKTFDYNIPEEMAKSVRIGSRVFVKFGNIKKLEEGFVIGIKEESKFKVKDIESVEQNFHIKEENIELAKWMARRYFCNISDCLKLMLPPGTTTKIITNRVKEKNANFAGLLKDRQDLEEMIDKNAIKSDRQVRILKFLLDNGDAMLQDIELFTDTTRSTIKTLEKNGYIYIYEKNIERNPFINKCVEKSVDLALNEEQQKAYDEVSECMDMGVNNEFLLFGVTGSR